MGMLRLFLFMLLIIPASGFAMDASNQEFISKPQWSKLSKGYDYTENIKKTNIKPKPYKPIATPSFGLAWVKYLLWGFVILVLLVLIIWLIISVLKGKSEKVSNKKSFETLTIDDIEDANLEDFLHQSLAEGSFKEAIRIRYLMLIRTLSRLHFVVWKKDKTNGSYVAEMHGKEGSDLFRLLTISFERAWYGEKEIGESEYHLIIPLFDQLNKIVMPNE